MAKELLELGAIQCPRHLHDELYCVYGDAVAEVCRDLTVSVKLPRHNALDHSTVHVIGTPLDVAAAKQRLQGIIADLNVVAHVHIPYRYRYYFLQDNAQVIRFLELHSYGTNIALSAACVNPTLVRITGPKINVEKVSEYIKGIIVELKTGKIPCEDSVLLNPHVAEERYQAQGVGIVTEYAQTKTNNHWILTRDNGSFIKHIERKYCVDVRLPKRLMRQEKISITGFWENVFGAKNELNREVNLTLYTSGWKKFELHAEIDDDCIGLIIGRKGQNIKRIREEYDVGIRLLSSKDSGGKSTVRVWGEEAAALAAYHEIKRTVDVAKEHPRLKALNKSINDAKLVEGWKAATELQSNATRKMICVHVKFEKKLHRMLLGVFGKQLFDYCKATGVRLRLPENSEEDHDRLYLIGREDVIRKLGKYFPTFLEHFEDEERVHISTACAEKLAENTKQFVSYFQERYNGVSIELDQIAGCQYVSIDGAADLMFDAKKAVEEIVEKVEENCAIPTELKQYIIKDNKQEKILTFEKYMFLSYLRSILRTHFSDCYEAKLFHFCLNAETACQYSGSKMLKPMEKISELPPAEEREVSIFTQSDFARNQVKNIARLRARQTRSVVDESVFPYVNKSIPVHRTLHPYFLGKKKQKRRRMEVNTGVTAIQYRADKDMAIVTGRHRNVDSCIGHILELSENFCRSVQVHRRTKNFVQKPRLKVVTLELPIVGRQHRSQCHATAFRKYDARITNASSTGILDKDHYSSGDSNFALYDKVLNTARSQLNIRGRMIKRAIKSLGEDARHLSRWDLKRAIAYKYEYRKQLKFPPSASHRIGTHKERINKSRSCLQRTPTFD